MTDREGVPPQPYLEKWDQQIVALQRRNDRLEDALQKIVAWSEAYPLDIFPEPNWGKVKYALLLSGCGITLDAISASNMRHVVEGVGKIAREALDDRAR